MSGTVGVCGTGIGNIVIPGDPNLSSSILSAQSALMGIAVSWTYPDTNAHAVAHTLLYRSTQNDFNTAILIRTVEGDYHLDQYEVAIGTTFYYWIQMVSINGTVGEVIGPASAMRLPTVEQLIDLFEGRLDDSVLVQSLKTRIDSITELTQDLIAEESARLLNEGLFGDFLDELTADLDTVAGQIVDEANARIAGDSVLVTQNNALVARMNNAEGAIQSLSTVEVYDDSALVEQVNTLAGRVGSAEAGIQSEEQVRVAADDAFALQLTTLSSTVGQNSADLVTERTTTVNEVSAVASEITLLTSKVFGADAAAYSSTNTLADDVVATANDLTALTSNFNGNVSTVNSQIQTISDAQIAQASSITTLEAALDGPDGITAALQQTQEVVSGPDGLSAQHMIKTDINGYVSGFGLYSESDPTGNNAYSEFIINADRFAVIKPGENSVYPFIIDNVNGTPVIALNATALIPDAQITNAMIGNYIQSNNYNGVNQGWRIDKNGNAQFNSLTIHDASGNVILSTGTGVEYQHVNGGPPADATRGAPNGTYVGNRLAEQLDSELDAAAAIVAQVDDIASDSKLTPTEKIALRREWADLQAQYFRLRLSLIENPAVNSNGLESAYSSLGTILNNGSYFGPTNSGTPSLLNSVTTTSNINGSSLVSAWTSYYQVYGDSSRALNQQNVNALNQINSSNVSTYIADLAVNTLQIANEAVIVPEYDTGTLNNTTLNTTAKTVCSLPVSIGSTSQAIRVVVMGTASVYQQGFFDSGAVLSVWVNGAKNAESGATLLSENGINMSVTGSFMVPSNWTGTVQLRITSSVSRTATVVGNVIVLGVKR